MFKWSQDKSISKVFMCVLMMWSDCEGGALVRVHIFIIAKGQKLELFGIIR